MTRSHLSVNVKGHLEMAGCDVVSLARRYGTPLFVMNEDLIRENCRRYKQAFAKHYPRFGVAYAGKAFLTGWISSVMDEEGMYLDVVSGGELYTALKAGFPANRVLFHGNNKSRDEIIMGLQAGVGRFVVDNMHEMDMLHKAATKLGKKAQVLIRVSPGVEAHTHEYIETGIVDSKFGFCLQSGDAWRAVRHVFECDSLVFMGINSHIGSQITSVEGPIRAATKLIDFISDLKQDLGIEVQELDLGGGLGVKYVESDSPPTIEQYVEHLSYYVTRLCEQRGVKLPMLFTEPGRSIVAEAGITVYTAGAIKHIPGVRTYVSVDGGMTDNPRHALYGAVYEAVLANRANAESTQTVCVAGKCCESGDVLIREARLPQIISGDLIAVLTTGAYNYSMASNYNRIPRPAVVAVSNGSARIVVRRETYADIVSKDVFNMNVPQKLPRASGARPGLVGGTT